MEDLHQFVHKSTFVNINGAWCRNCTHWNRCYLFSSLISLFKIRVINHSFKIWLFITFFLSPNVLYTHTNVMLTPFKSQHWKRNIHFQKVHLCILPQKMSCAFWNSIHCWTWSHVSRNTDVLIIYDINSDASYMINFFINFFLINTRLFAHIIRTITK